MPACFRAPFSDWMGPSSTTEVDVTNGLPSFIVVGLPDTAVQESRERVQAACERQRERFAGTDLAANADRRPAEVRRFCKLDEAGTALLRTAMAQLQLTARSFHRVLTIARTITDFCGRGGHPPGAPGRGAAIPPAAGWLRRRFPHLPCPRRMASRPLACAGPWRDFTGGVCDPEDGFCLAFSERVFRIFLSLVLRNNPWPRGRLGRMRQTGAAPSWGSPSSSTNMQLRWWHAMCRPRGSAQNARRAGGHDMRGRSGVRHATPSSQKLLFP